MKRLFVIGLFILLMIATIVVGGYSYRTSLQEARVTIGTENKEVVIPAEKGVFERSSYALDYTDMPIDEAFERSLNTYYNNRAYHGAPPSIPHPVENEIDMGGNSCLKCHENGGFVNTFQAYAPVTPHPEKINCRQCHVVQKTLTVFKGTAWKGADAPVAGTNAALTGSPPIIPHDIQLRENCLACHAGPSAPREIRVSHPERINCRQCHVLNSKTTTDIGDFTRKVYDKER